MKIYIKTSPSAAFDSIDVVDKPLGTGGQGCVHNITTAKYKNCCVKIYKDIDAAQNTYDRIAFMVQNPPKNITGSNSFRICWPVALAYNTSKRFVGYVMPLAFPESRDLLILSTYNAKPISQQARYKKYTAWHDKYELTSTIGIKNRIKMLCNWAIAIYSIHETGKYILIDLKPQNVMATASGKISVVDTDSFQISENGKILFPATAFTPDYLAPEGKSLYLNNKPFTEYCDRFAIAIIFYTILTGTHPYSGTVLKPPYDKYVTFEECIAQGLFAFGDKKQYISFNPGLNLHKNFHNLPVNIQQLFIRAFGNSPSNRPSMEEWGKALHEAASDSVKIAASTIKPANTNTIPIHITNAQFCDKDYDNNKIITPNGGKLYTDITYLVPTIYYDVINTIGSVDIWYKIYDPNGNLRSNNSNPGFTWKGTVNLANKGSYSCQLGGWGHENKTVYNTPGTWKVEFYYKNSCLYRTSVTIHSKSSTSNYTSTSNTTRTTTSTPISSYYNKNKKSSSTKKVVLWTLGIVAVIAAAFFALPLFTGTGNNMYSICNSNTIFTDTVSGSTNHDVYTYGDKVSIDNTSSAWTQGSVNGHDGYIRTSDLVSYNDFHRLNKVWASSAELAVVNLTRYRKAILHFIKKLNLETGQDGFQLQLPSEAQFPNRVFFSNVSDNYNYYRDFAFILTNKSSRTAWAAFYSFDKNGEPILQKHKLTDLNSGIVNITYSKSKGHNFLLSNMNVSYEQKKNAQADIAVTSLLFANANYNNNRIGYFDSKLFSDKLLYLQPQITYTGLKKKNKSTLSIRIYNQNGDLLKGQSSPQGFTFNQVLKNIQNSEYYQVTDILGWGNKNGGVYSPGEYIYEIWNHSEKIASRNVFIYDSQNPHFENYHIK